VAERIGIDRNLWISIHGAAFSEYFVNCDRFAASDDSNGIEGRTRAASDNPGNCAK